MSTSTSTPFHFPTTFLSRLQDASEKYTIRPFHPTDLKPCTEIFIQGMLEYNGQGTNKRTPFPSLDPIHQQIQIEAERKWEQGFQHYVDYSMVDPNMSDLVNYWSLPRRSIYLVAIENKTNQVVGSVAIQPGTLLSSCKYFDPYKLAIQSNTNSRQDIHNNNTQSPSPTSTTSLPSKSTSTSPTIVNDSTVPFPIHNPMSLVQLWCNYALGSIPGEFYRLDDPTVEPASFIPFPTVILPTPSTTSNTSINNIQNVPNPITNAKCGCSQHGKCISNQTAIKLSKLNAQQRTKFVQNLNFNQNKTTTIESNTPIASTEQCSSETTITTNNDTNNQTIPIGEIFCQCVINADTKLDQIMQLFFNQHNVSNNQVDLFQENITKLLPCPYCIQDAQYLIQPFIPHTDSTQSNRQYQINPILASYSNIFTNSSPSTISFTQPITTRLPFSTITPHGYFRRFNRAGTYTANIVNNNNDTSAAHLDQFPIVQFPTKLPVGLTPNTYLNFLLEEEEYAPCNQKKQMNIVENDKTEQNDENCPEDEKYKFWLNHINITSSLQDSIPFPKATATQRSQLLSTTTNELTTSESKSQQILQLPWGDICEFRRMSVARPHRSSGLGYVLLLAALQTAFQVFKFKRLHLSTSWVMDTACRFYRKCGLREVLADYEAMYGTHCMPIAHFSYQFTPTWVQSFKYKEYIIRYNNTIAPEYNNIISPWFDSYLTPEFQQLQSLQCIADQVNGGCNGNGDDCDEQQ